MTEEKGGISIKIHIPPVGMLITRREATQVYRELHEILIKPIEEVNYD